MINVIIFIAGLIATWVITHLYYKLSSKGAILSFESQSVSIISAKDWGRKVSISVEGKEIKTLVSVQIALSLNGNTDLTKANFAEKKPSLRFHNMDIIDIRTINNKREQFDIPIGRPDNRICIFNIRYFKRKAHAIFQVIGSLEDDESEVKCLFCEGQGIGVAIDGTKLSNCLNVREK